jgi:hypothetical protein
MKLTDAFPSNFLKADDLQGKEVTVKIEEVTLEELGQGNDKEEKLMISFQGKSKKLVCNKTNARTIEKLHGGDTDDWIGKRIILAPREVEFQGEQVWAIRVSLRNPEAAAATAKAVASKPEPSDNDGTISEDEPGF